MKERISIALATFNGERYIAEQLQSIKRQTYQPDELIISDDCSIDSTVDIAHAFAKTVQFEVKIFINKSNHGYSQNFSRALQYCTGDIVFLSDQDDVWLPNKIEKMIGWFSSNPEVQLFIHDLEYCKEDLTVIGQTKIERMREVFDLNRGYVVGMATAIRGPFLKLCLPIPSKGGVAHDFWLHSCARAIDKKRIMCEVLALYRRHASTATNLGNLNVDFFTSPDHFDNGLLTHKTILPSAQIATFSEWLQANRSVLIERNYASPERLDGVTEDEKRRMESSVARAEILAMRRLGRFWAVLGLISRGGYRYFHGWKSAMKDLFLN